ncbi:unnamed protein product, partial [Mesorhabditis belari]|uniref:Gustatory receptor n=1 Tax=Mesorhabditis belari TaxID=2138241 RepID=A0AAF3F4V7_9BILA
MRSLSREDEMAERCVPAPTSSTRSWDHASTSDVPSRADNVRRSLKELRRDMGRSFGTLVHRPQGLERIQETDGHENGLHDKDVTSRPIESERPSIFERLQRTIDELPSLPNMSGEGSVIERIDTSLNAHYYTIAYCVVITAYVLGFAEYVYLRLVSILIPEKMKFYKTCQERANETVGKDGFHYGVSLGAFIVIALFQLICFFGLTISEKWTRTSHFGPASASSLRREQLASQIRCVISKIMYRTFLCYGLCSGIICMIIFNVVGIQDSIGDTISQICIYTFDALIIIYFLAFPLCTIIYHPHVYCFKSRPAAESVDPADLSISRGEAPLVHNSTSTRLATLAEVPEPSYSASPIPSSIPPLMLPTSIDREPRPGSSRSSDTMSAREPPYINRETPFKRGIRTTTTV